MEKFKTGNSKNLTHSIVEGSFNAGSASIANQFTVPYLLALGATNTEIGLSTSLQNFADIVSQIPGGRLTKRFSRKAVWNISVVASKLMWIPLILIPLLFTKNIALIVTFLTFASFFTSLRSPAWSSMMGDIVPPHNRGRYFAKRNMITGICGMSATFLAGLLLTYYGFPFILSLSVALGLMSIIFFNFMKEPHFKIPYSFKYTFSMTPTELGRTIKSHKSFVIFTIYIFATNFAVNISSPFVAVFILKDLSVDYTLYGIAVSIGLFSRLVFQRYWGVLNDRYGNKKVITMGAILIAIVPLGYVFASNSLHVIILKAFDGIAWAGFDLAVFNFLLGSTPSAKRPSYVANHNLFVGLGTVGGSLIGSYLITVFGNSNLFWLHGIGILFLISFILRSVSIVLIGAVKDVKVKDIDDIRLKDAFVEILATAPLRDIKHIASTTSDYKDKYSEKLDVVRKGIEKIEDKVYNIEGYREVNNLYPKKGEMAVETEKLSDFSDCERILKKAKGGAVLFVKLKTDIQDEFKKLEAKNALLKLKENCQSIGIKISPAADNWFLVHPENSTAENLI